MLNLLVHHVTNRLQKVKITNGQTNVKTNTDAPVPAGRLNNSLTWFQTCTDGTFNLGMSSRGTNKMYSTTAIEDYARLVTVRLTLQHAMMVKGWGVGGEVQLHSFSNLGARWWWEDNARNDPVPLSTTGVAQTPCYGYVRPKHCRNPIYDSEFKAFCVQRITLVCAAPRAPCRPGDYISYNGEYCFQHYYRSSSSAYKHMYQFTCTEHQWGSQVTAELRVFSM